MKKALLALFCAAFFAFSAFFSLGMLIPGASVAEEGAASPPALIEDGRISDDFGDRFEDYFSKSFAYRSRVVSAFASLRERVFATGNDQVTLGRDGFLFFNESLDDYTGEAAMTDGEIAAAASALDDMARYCAAHSARFLFVCAPSKATVYADMLPSRISAAQESDLDRLYAGLSRLGVEYVDLRPALAEAKESALIYHKRDSHWNGRGAAAAFGAVMTALGRDVPEFGEFHAEHTFEGDLDRLLYPGEVRYDDNEVQDMTGRYIFTSAYSTPMDMTIASRGEGVGRLLIFRDSFANALIPYLASSFSEARFERANPYRLDLLGGIGSGGFAADTVIVEIAERNLRDLIGAGGRIKN